MQSYCFDRVLSAAEQAGRRVITVHSQGAADEVLDALHEHPNAGIAVLYWFSGGVLYWFSGSKRQVDRAAAMGCWQGNRI